MNMMSTRFIRALFILLILGLSVQTAQANRLLDRIVAVVNDDIILLSELNAQLEQAREELRQRNIANSDPSALRLRVLDNMIMQKLQQDRAKQRGLRVSDDEINNQLLQMAEANELTLLQLQEVLNREMPNGFARIRGQVSEQILIQKLREVEIISQIHVTEDEMNNFIQRRNLQTANEEFQLAHILITRPESPTPEQRAELQAKVDDIYKQLQLGADFSQMAVRHSEGSRALTGGDLGWLNFDQMPTFFANEVVRLQPGQISRVIDVPSGYHIIKLLDKRSSQQSGQAVEQEAMQAIRIRKANETFDLWMRRLRDEAYIDMRLDKVTP